ncbi:MAG: hypothetical protein DRJ38_08675 [Thermoprotei archaeon]|nr:MAG: hypothetical protein DRJ38_08675 [Thermoprotei archaeon]
MAAVLEILPIDIPFYKFLTIDITGVPLLLALYIFGLPSAVSSTLIASFVIALPRPPFKGPNPYGAFFKGLAELSTIAGVYLSRRFWKDTKWFILSSFIFGSIIRAIVMCMANYTITPVLYGMPYSYILAIMPIIAIFNIIQTAVNVVLAVPIYEKIKVHLSSLISSSQ